MEDKNIHEAAVALAMKAVEARKRKHGDKYNDAMRDMVNKRWQKVKNRKDKRLSTMDKSKT